MERLTMISAVRVRTLCESPSAESPGEFVPISSSQKNIVILGGGTIVRLLKGCPSISVAVANAC